VKESEYSCKISNLIRNQKQRSSKPACSGPSTTSRGSAGAEQILVGKEARGKGGGSFCSIICENFPNSKLTFHASCQATNAAYRSAYSVPPNLNSGVGGRLQGWNGSNGPMGRQEDLAPSVSAEQEHQRLMQLPREIATNQQQAVDTILESDVAEEVLDTDINY